MTMNVTDALRDFAQLEGRAVEVSGVLFHHWGQEPESFDEIRVDYVFLAPDVDHWNDKSRCIFVNRLPLRRS